MGIEDIQSGAIQYRSAEVKDVDQANREMLVRAAPYDITCDIGGGIDETFMVGTFARAAKAPHRLSAFWEHGGPLIGRGVSVEDKDDGIWVRARIGRTTAANDVMSLVEDGLLSDVSVEFRPIPEAMDVVRHGDRMAITHRRAHLVGFAVVTEGAYGPHAFVESVRDAKAERAREEMRLWLSEYRRRGVG